MAATTVLESERCGSLLDGNKAHPGARAIILGAKGGGDRQVMATRLGSAFSGQRLKSTIDYIVTDEASQIVKAAETMLKNKRAKYAASAEGNEHTHAVLSYLVEFMRQLKIDADALGV